MTKKEKLLNYRNILYLIKMAELSHKNDEPTIEKEKQKVLVLKKKFYGKDLIVG